MRVQVLVELEFNVQPVRMLLIANMLWFVAEDVCKILGYGDAKRACSGLKDFEKCLNSELMCVSELGLYRLALTSTKPQAEPFLHWIACDILPLFRGTTAVNECVKTHATAKARAKVLGYSDQQIGTGSGLNRYVLARVKPSLPRNSQEIYYEVTYELDRVIEDYFVMRGVFWN